jgi:hypothetical protein
MLLCGVLRKRLHLKVHKLSIIQGVERWTYAFKCKRFSNTRRTVTFGITILKLLLTHPVHNVSLSTLVQRFQKLSVNV